MAGNRKYDEERFRELVQYIAWKTKDDPHFGRTKLAKALFYSDLCAYAEEGRSLTGAAYKHWQHGPFPPALYDAQDWLLAEGRAQVKRPEFKGDEARLIAFEEPEEGHFRGHPIVESYIKKIAEQPTWKVRDASHQHPGWDLTEQGEEIPYHVAFMSRRRPTDEDFRRADEIAVDLGWK